ncbi:hypothetical protein IV203_015682 [Nitzschia inconspicua]|uniref:Globin domain-containing protein n=1 Tax=Nitzschia inconspicua TaxID=303405 RepID=A0A9K3LBS7_9STRA|nr:hypothetical protein IV203_015682 [Nitzschia inconspicua]
MHKDITAEQGIAIMDHRHVEQICLSWHLIKESDSNYKESMAVVLDKRISAVMSRVMRDRCPDVPAHTRAIVMQLDMMVHYLEGDYEYNSILAGIFRTAGERHANLSLQPKHYSLLNEALLGTLEHFLKSSSGYWHRVQKSWSTLFEIMFKEMKYNAKREEHRQEQLMRPNRRKERRELQTSPPPKNSSLISTMTTTSEESVTDFSSSSHDFPYNSLQELPLLNDCTSIDFHKDGITRSVVCASPPTNRKSRLEMLRSTKSRPVSMRNLFVTECPATPESRYLKKDSKSKSMKNIFAKDSPISHGRHLEKISSNTRAASLRNIFGKNTSNNSPSQIESDSALSPISPSPKSSREKVYGSPKAVACPSGRPGLSRMHSRRRDCAVFAMDSPETPRSQRSIKLPSPSAKLTPKLEQFGRN